MKRVGEFPLEEKVSVRVDGKTKRLLKKLKDKGHNEREVLTFGALKLADEPLLLEWEIGEMDVELSAMESALFALKSRKQAKLNRLKVIAPDKLDEATLNNLLVESAKEYAQEIVSAHGLDSLSMIEKRKKAVLVTGEEWGYDPQLFLDEVRNQIRILCQTDVSDI